MKRTSKSVLTVITALFLVFTAACAPAVTKEEKAGMTEEEKVVTPTPTMEWGTIEIRVTDPPPADVKSAVVHFNSVKVHKVSDNTSESDNISGWITVIGEGSFDLMDVIGVEKVLGSANVTAGSFTQIRMDVAKVSGETTDNVSYTAAVPSGGLKIVRPFNVGGGMTTILTLDFDGAKSLVRTGSGKFLFEPVVKLLIEKVSGADEEEVEKP